MRKRDTKQDKLQQRLDEAQRALLLAKRPGAIERATAEIQTVKELLFKCRDRERAALVRKQNQQRKEGV